MSLPLQVKRTIDPRSHFGPLTQRFLRPSNKPVFGGARESVLDVDCGSFILGPRGSFPVGDSVHSEDVAVFCNDLVGLHWVSLSADHQGLRKMVRV